MHENRVPPLKIRNLEIYPPIIQGGMGVRVSGANLAAAVANTGCAGVIASAGLGFFDGVRGGDARKLGQDLLRAEIRKARRLTHGPLGVNILVALTDYENLVRVAAEEKADMIISGAGLPLGLPGYVGDNSEISLIPIVSSARTFNIICRRWQTHFHRLPDAVVVEGPMAGGHLGYSKESLADRTAATVEQTVVEVVAAANACTPRIPVIAAGGIFDGGDIARFLNLGASGVQMATRFVCTDECDVHENFKRAYLAARQEDITIIDSPVGLPGRVIDNAFVARIKQGQTVPFSCRYHCLRSCDSRTAPYCIAEVLTKAALGRLDESFAFAGSNAWRCHEIVPVQKLVDTLMAELTGCYAESCPNSQNAGSP